MKYMRVKEPQVQHAILSLLANGQIWTNARIKRELRKVLPLSPADLETANHRPNEAKWEELVNNALSPSRGNSLIAKGYVETVDRGHHRITDDGRRELKDCEELDACFRKAMASPEVEKFLRQWNDHRDLP